MSRPTWDQLREQIKPSRGTGRNYLGELADKIIHANRPAAAPARSLAQETEREVAAEAAGVRDVVVTVPLSFGLDTWIEEGDPAGVEEWTGTEWGFTTRGANPRMQPGDRVYVVFNRRLRGYAPLIRVDMDGQWLCFVRGGGAVAVTIDEEIIGFRGWRRVWWPREAERPFPEWTTP